MLLEFAETQDKQPVHISRVRPGLTRDLFCPACQQRVKANTRAVDPWIPVPHFAHVGAVCHYIQQYTRTRHIRVPFYRDFEQSHHDRVSPLVPPTRLPPATLPLAELYTLQQEAIKQEFVRFHAEFIRPQASQEPPVSLLTDLKLFEWTIEKFSLFTLYFVEIHQPTGIIYHIGSSDQPEEVYFTTLREELFFIARFPVGNIQAISPLLALPQMASVEFYVQHRFREYRYHFTEEHRLPDYFSFSPGEGPKVA